MSAALLATLPLQLVCHLIIPGAPGVNDTNFAVHQLPPQIQTTKLPNGATAVPLAPLSLEIVCQLLVTSNPGVTENGTLVYGDSTTPMPSVTTPEDDLMTRTISPETTPDYSASTPATSSEPISDDADEVFNAVFNETSTDYYDEPSVSITMRNYPDGYVAFPEDHAAYKIYREGATWYGGRDRCIEEGARLAIPDTTQKIAHINSLKSDWGSQWLHVGIYKSSTTDQWTRIDTDLPATSLPWMDTEPNGTGNCAGISFVTDGLVDYVCEWDDEYFVCEVPI